MIVDYCKQGSDEWLFQRLGIPTASNFSKIITGTGKPSASSGLYLEKLLNEYITQQPSDEFQSSWMSRGIRMEPEALAAYSFINDVELDKPGLIFKDEWRLVACSPDSLIKGMKKGIEAKCPSPDVHKKYLKDNKLPTKYIPQVQGHMYITGFDSWDFMSYHPKHEPLIVTVQRDQKYIDKMHSLVSEFINDLMDARILIDLSIEKASGGNEETYYYKQKMQALGIR